MRNIRLSRKLTMIAIIGVHDSPPISDDTEVWVTTGTRSEPVRGTVRGTAGAPRSYNVEVPSGDIRRNRGHIRVVPQSSHQPAQTASAPGPVAKSEEPTVADSNNRGNPSSPPSTSPARRVVTRSQTGNSAGMPRY